LTLSCEGINYKILICSLFVHFSDDAFAKKGNHMEQRQRLGLTDNKIRSNPRKLPTEPASALEKVEVNYV
jgi:hypothetical protein